MRVSSFPSALYKAGVSTYEEMMVLRMVSPPLLTGVSPRPTANSLRRSLVSSVSIPVTVVLLTRALQHDGLQIRGKRAFRSGGAEMVPAAAHHQHGNRGQDEPCCRITRAIVKGTSHSIHCSHYRNTGGYFVPDTQETRENEEIPRPARLDSGLHRDDCPAAAGPPGTKSGTRARVPRQGRSA